MASWFYERMSGAMIAGDGVSVVAERLKHDRELARRSGWGRQRAAFGAGSPFPVGVTGGGGGPWGPAGAEDAVRTAGTPLAERLPIHIAPKVCAHRFVDIEGWPLRANWIPAVVHMFWSAVLEAIRKLVQGHPVLGLTRSE